MENGLGCPAKRTSMQQKKAFENVVKQAVGDDEATEEVFLKLQDSLCTMLDRQEEAGNEDTPIELNQDVFHDVITDSDISESLAPKIEKHLPQNLQMPCLLPMHCSITKQLQK